MICPNKVFKILLASICVGFMACTTGDDHCNHAGRVYTATRPEWLSDFIPTNYSNRLPPLNNSCPSVLYVAFIPWAFGEISIRTMTIEVDMTVQIYWFDRRLKIPKQRISQIIVLDQEEVARLWTPTLQFKNCMHCKEMAANPNVDKMWVIGSSLSFSKRIAAKFHCIFDLTAYPMDTQDCFVELQTNGDPIWSIRLEDISNHANLTTLSASTVTEFKLEKLYRRNCTTELISQMFSCVSYGFILQRQMTYHLMLTYCPSLLIVVLSWFSFWLDVDASAPRVTIGLTSLLTLATQFANAQKNLPAVSYVKAIDIWMFVCMFMVFGSLLEFAIANNVARVKHVRTVKPVKEMSNYRLGSKLKFLNGTPDPQKKLVLKKVNNERGRSIIDSIAQILFPLSFIVFNVVYWGYFYFVL